MSIFEEYGAPYSSKIDILLPKKDFKNINPCPAE